MLDPPWREAARFAGLVEEDDIAVGIAKPRLAPHPRLVARTMLEGDAGAGQLLDPLVEVVAFEIDRGRRDDALLGVDLRPRRWCRRRFRSAHSRCRAVDDLLEAELAVEVDRALVIGAGHGHLVEPEPCPTSRRTRCWPIGPLPPPKVRRLEQARCGRTRARATPLRSARSPRRGRWRSRWPACSRCRGCWWCRSAGPASWSCCRSRSARRRARRLPRARP